MTSTRIKLGMAALAGVALVAVVAAARTARPARAVPPSHDTAAVSSRSSPELRALSLEVAALRAEVARERDHRAPRSGDAPSSPSEAPPEPELSPEDVQALRFHELEERVQSEPVDARWSRDAPVQIAEVFRSGAAAGTTLTSTRCASTLCRVEVAHDDQAAQRGLSAAIADAAPFRAGVYYSASADGKHTVLYVSRPSGQAE